MADSNSAARSLVVNADDLGLHTDINRGIEKAHCDGIVTSASLCVVGDAFEDAVATCRRCPDLDIGLHLTLVEERPLTPARGLRGLVRGNGRFPQDHAALVARLLTGQVSAQAVRREAQAQLDKLLEVGLRPTHLDAHQHVHLLPTIWPVVVELALENDIGWIRLPRFEPIGAGAPGPKLMVMRSGLNVLQSVRRTSHAGLRCADATPALGFSGHLTVDRIVRSLRGERTSRVVELVAHPGVTSKALETRYQWGFDWSGETAALTDQALREALEQEGFALTTFASLAA